jgi:uncharacterized membrane protein YfcA
MGPLELLVLFLAALAQGFLGFGYGILAVGGLSLLQDLEWSASVVNVTGLVTTTGLVLALARHADWRLVLRLAPGIGIGIVAGVYLLGSLDTRPLKLMLGVSITAIAAWNLSTWRPTGHPPAWYDGPVSLVSGVFTGLFNMGAPPLIAHVYRRDETPDALRATVQLTLLISVVVRLGTAFGNGMLTTDVWRASAIGVIASVFGAALGLFLGRRISAARFQRATWCALALFGVGIAFSSA